MTERRGGQQFIPRPPSVRAGAPAPWRELTDDARRLPLTAVRDRLVGLPENPTLPDWWPRAEASTDAAVLVPLYERDGEAIVVLIKRPETMPSHRGEIAFPGGKFEPVTDADLRATALREAHEEVGLEPDAVEIVAQLQPIATVASRFTITPFVGFLAGEPELVPDPREVVRTLEVPLSELMAEDVYREELWDTRREGLGIHFYELSDETVWGATARILTGLLAHLTAAR